MIDVFKRQFPTAWQMVEDSPNYRLDIVEHRECIGVGSTATVLFRCANNRAFGAVWRIEKATLNGLRARNFDGSKPDDSPANADFLLELDRRLQTDGAAREEVANRMGITGHHPRHHTRMQRELARAAY